MSEPGVKQESGFGASSWPWRRRSEDGRKKRGGVTTRPLPECGNTPHDPVLAALRTEAAALLGRKDEWEGPKGK
jgi:hypothetical protein